MSELSRCDICESDDCRICKFPIIEKFLEDLESIYFGMDKMLYIEIIKKWEARKK